MIAMNTDAVHPATIQRYLIRWATWWCPVTGENKDELIGTWVTLAVKVQAALVWSGPADQCLHHGTASERPVLMTAGRESARGRIKRRPT